MFFTSCVRLTMRNLQHILNGCYFHFFTGTAFWIISLLVMQVEGQTEEVIFDHLHATAFQYTPLGRTILGPAQNIRTITKEHLKNYISTHYTAPRMVCFHLADFLKYANPVAILLHWSCACLVSSFPQFSMLLIWRNGYYIPLIMIQVISASGSVKHEDIVAQVRKLFTKLSDDPTTVSQLVAKKPASFTGSEVGLAIWNSGHYPLVRLAAFTRFFFLIIQFSIPRLG